MIFISIILKLQLEQEILDFVEGLRAVGVKADEKIALFADNSCRWLVADQGTYVVDYIKTQYPLHNLLSA